MKTLKSAKYRLYRIQPDGSLLDLGMQQTTFLVDEPSYGSDDWKPTETIDDVLEDRESICSDFESLVDMACELEGGND